MRADSEGHSTMRRPSFAACLSWLGHLAMGCGRITDNCRVPGLELLAAMMSGLGDVVKSCGAWQTPRGEARK
jgi:hypothetical protein